MACDRLATCSPAIVSGSTRRTATWEMARADWRNSRMRRASAAKANRKKIGPIVASRNSGRLGPEQNLDEAPATVGKRRKYP